MTKYIRDTTIALGLLVGWLLVGLSAAQAQTAPSASEQIGTPASIEKSIVTAIGAEAKTVEVTSSSGILLVARVNSNMNVSTHEGRNNEAQVIATLVAKGSGATQNSETSPRSGWSMWFVLRQVRKAKSLIALSFERTQTEFLIFTKRSGRAPASDASSLINAAVRR